MDHQKPALVRLMFIFTFRLCAILGLIFQVYITGDRSGPGSTEIIGPEVYTGWFLKPATNSAESKDMGSRDTSTPHSLIFSLFCKIKQPDRSIGIRALPSPALYLGPKDAPTTSWGRIWLETQGQFLVYSPHKKGNSYQPNRSKVPLIKIAFQ